MVIAISDSANRLARLLVGLICLAALVVSSADAGTEYEQLIVFVQPGASEVDAVFHERQLPEIRKIAESMGVAVHVVDAGDGVPAEVAITPLMVYQNHRGRSVYQGRPTTIGRIRNFIRTARFVPQGDAPNRRRSIPIRTLGRTRIWAPLKVSAVTGSPPENYDNASFQAEARENIARGFNHFTIQGQADLGRADRGFYMDFYPWLSEDGTLFLSLAVYSQFHCKEPIFETQSNPLTGPWQSRGRLFQQAAALMENVVAEQMKRPETGDAFDPVPRNAAMKTWEDLGYPLPPVPPRQAEMTSADATLPMEWTVDTAGPGDPPMILFRFPAPLDNYAGEVTLASGQMTLPEDLALDGARGMIAIDTRSAITMGEPVLDEAILGSALLSARAFPTSTFTIESVSSGGRILAYGQLTPASVSGTFSLKGKSVPMSTVAEVEPVIGDDGRPRLLVRTSFTIDLRTFDIEGADGPAPARYTVLIDVNLKLRSSPEQ